MSKTERLRETLSTPLSAADVAQKLNEGWRMVSVEWERESEATAVPEPLSEEVPFGPQVGDDCRHLQANIPQKQFLILILIMEMIVQVRKLSQIGDELNQHRYPHAPGEELESGHGLPSVAAPDRSGTQAFSLAANGWRDGGAILRLFDGGQAHGLSSRRRPPRRVQNLRHHHVDGQRR